MRTDRKQVNIIYDGLDVNCEITSIDPLDQVFYAGSNTYIPNRSLTPLVLMPKLEIMNSSGAKVATAFTKTSWYFGEIKEGTLITSKVSTDDYYIDGFNLVVKKNLDNPIQISFLGEFIDKRTKKIIQVPRVVELSVLSTSEIAPAPTIGIDRPADWAFNPIRDSNIQTLTASVFVNEKAYASAVRWLVEHNGKKETIDLYDCYVSGQHSHQLIVDTDKLPSGALIWAENMSEEFYNKIYGINPGWDGRMHEVFENRNLIISPYWVYGGIDSNGNLTSLNTSTRTSYYIPVESNVKYYVQLEKIEGTGKGYGVNFFDANKKATAKQIWWSANVDKSYEFTTPADCKYVMFNCFPALPLTTKIIMSTKAIKNYTPAPEDLNFRNLITNGDFRDGTKWWSGWQSRRNLTLKGLEVQPEKVNNIAQAWINNYGNPVSNDLLYACMNLFTSSKISKIDLKWGSSSDAQYNQIVSKSSPLGNFNLSGTFSFHKNQSRFIMVQFMSDNIDAIVLIENTYVINLTQIFGKGNEPSKEQLDAVFANMDYIPSPQDIAPDGILPGIYSTNVPFFVKYPALKVSVADFGDLLESDPSHKLEAEVIYNKGRLDNPSKYIDNQFIIGYANDREEVVGTGNSVVVPAAKFQGAKYVDMDWDFKPRPLTLTKNLNTKEQTKLIEK